MERCEGWGHLSPHTQVGGQRYYWVQHQLHSKTGSEGGTVQHTENGLSLICSHYGLPHMYETREQCLGADGQMYSPRFLRIEPEFDLVLLSSLSLIICNKSRDSLKASVQPLLDGK